MPSSPSVAHPAADPPAHDLSPGLPPAFRRQIFLHQDGLLLALCIEALEQRGLLQHLAEHSPASVAQIATIGACQPAILQVILRCLAQVGWLTRAGRPGNDHLTYAMTPTGRQYFQHSLRYRRVAQFLMQSVPLEKTLLTDSHASATELAALVDSALNGWGMPLAWQDSAEQRIQLHLDGALLVPVLIALWQLDALDKPWHIHASPGGPHLIHWFIARHWLHPNLERWTPAGGLIKDQVLHYGMAGSYLAMLMQLPQMLYGATSPRITSSDHTETHVDRRMNVIASAHAHRRYFRDTDEIFIELFDREPLLEQPRFIADMGCGDGSWLVHIYELVRARTLRGRHLHELPLLMIGSDYNDAALQIARGELERAQIPSLVLAGDVTDPDRFAADLQAHGLDIVDGLHIRAFIDHNRLHAAEHAAQAQPVELQSSGAYLDSAGRILANELVAQDLVMYLRRWTPHVRQHGMVLLEAHCVDPSLTARHLGDTHNVVFDTYHALSRQYPVDFNVFMEAVEHAGLRALLYRQKRYPSRLPFVSISLNRLVAAPPAPPIAQQARAMSSAAELAEEWRPSGAEDLADGEALHRLVYRDAAATQPRAWCAAATGALIARVLARLQKRAADIEASRAERVISVLDYGTGTGLFAIELRRAMTETGLLQRLTARGIRFRLALADLPTGWFAKGYELLRDAPDTHFYSLRDGARFVSLAERSAHRYDVAVASMVFHLIPPPALAAMSQNLADVLRPGGCLLWNAPDIAPANHGSVMFHEGNRRLRARVLHYCDHPVELAALVARVPPEEREHYEDLPSRLQTAHASSTSEALVAARRMAERQVLPQPTPLALLNDSLNRHFTGSTFTRSFEMLPNEALDTVLVPANQRLLSEISDLELRRRITEVVMRFEVLPALCNSLAGTADGYAVQWTFGEHDRA